MSDYIKRAPQMLLNLHLGICRTFLTLLFLNSRAGYPYGAAEVFSLMQHMGCEPDRASFNIMVDAYGRAGLYEGKYLYQEVKIYSY